MTFCHQIYCGHGVLSVYNMNLKFTCLPQEIKSLKTSLLDITVSRTRRKQQTWLSPGTGAMGGFPGE